MLKNTKAAQAKGEFIWELATINRLPKPSNPPTNSPMTTPITASVTATLAPENMCGNAARNLILKKI